MTPAAGGPSRDPEEIDAEFERIMTREGLAATGPARARGPAHDPLDDDPAVIAAEQAPAAPMPDRLVMAWTALIVGLALLLLPALAPAAPRWIAFLGGFAAGVGMLSLFAQIPRSRDEDDNGARV